MVVAVLRPSEASDGQLAEVRPLAAAVGDAAVQAEAERRSDEMARIAAGALPCPRAHRHRLRQMRLAVGLLHPPAALAVLSSQSSGSRSRSSSPCRLARGLLKSA